MNKLLVGLIALFSFSHIVLAQNNTEIGKDKLALCVACHRADGNSASSIYPNLSGQHRRYLKKQLLQFKNGERTDPLMAGMVALLSDQDIHNLSTYYATQIVTTGASSPVITTIGKNRYMGGDIKRKIPACTACHGPHGYGLALAKFPMISNQPPAYLKAQLEMFRRKIRNNDPNNMMVDVASKITDADIELLSNYISALH